MGFSRGQRALLVGIAACVVVGTSVLSRPQMWASDLAPRFHWPDETTNAFFARRVATGQSMRVEEPRNTAVGNIIHPRTANVRADGALVPGGYLGLPLWYGLLGRGIGIWAMGLFTPLLAGGALVALAYIVRVGSGEVAVALLAAVFLALHPSWWLFSATAFLPNVPFAALLLIGIALLVRPLAASAGGDRRVLAAWGIGGCMVGVALTMRTHEALWVGALVLLIARWRRVRWTALLAAGVGAVLPFLPVLVLQQQLYGHPFTTGYALLQEGGAAPTEFVRTGLPIPASLQALVAPFGWYPFTALRHAWTYLVQPYWWLVGLAGVGCAVRWRSRSTWAMLAMVLWLLLMYGSWVLADPLVRSTNVWTISYVRYWIPMIVLWTPWAAYGCVWLVRRCPWRWRPLAQAVVLVGIAFLTVARAVTDPDEGLRRQAAAIAEHRLRAQAVLAATEPDAVICSDRMDKTFFPERAVVHIAPAMAQDPNLRARLRALIDRAPVYWYAPSESVRAGLQLQEVPGGALGEQLYRVIGVAAA
ncbi:hypothetical protein HYV74_00105 [Candidatus Uhrbacteria bacterium]|nr:hypothetical protein [Candidatus Uhrbacteria bacterium]